MSFKTLVKSGLNRFSTSTMIGFYDIVTKLQAPSKQAVPINFSMNTTYHVTF